MANFNFVFPDDYDNMNDFLILTGGCSKIMFLSIFSISNYGCRLVVAFTSLRFVCDVRVEIVCMSDSICAIVIR